MVTNKAMKWVGHSINSFLWTLLFWSAVTAVGWSCRIPGQQLLEQVFTMVGMYLKQDLTPTSTRKVDTIDLSLSECIYYFNNNYRVVLAMASDSRAHLIFCFIVEGR